MSTHTRLYDTWSDAMDYWVRRSEDENDDYWTAYKNTDASASTSTSSSSSSGSSSTSGTSSSSGSSGSQKTSTEEETGTTAAMEGGRYAQAIAAKFDANEYGRFDTAEARKDYAKYYRDRGLITQDEYKALLARYE